MTEIEDRLLALDDGAFTIWVHHVGGGPDTDLTKEVEGPLTGIPECRWVIYDAQEGATAKSRSEGHIVVQRAVGGRKGVADFHITEVPSASSMYRPSEAARENWFPHGGRLQDWGSHSKVRRTVKVDVDTIDNMVGSKEVPPVDFLSVDAQGAELEILDGASRMLKDRTVGVIIEAEFSPLYEGQPLFCDTMARLVRDGFRLVGIYSTQHFHTAPFDLGPGFLTVGEPFYLRGYHDTSDEPSSVLRALKTAAVAGVFDRRDYAWAVCHWLERVKGVSVERLAASSGVKYLSMLSTWSGAR